MTMPFPFHAAPAHGDPLAALAQLAGGAGPANDPLTPGDQADPFGAAAGAPGAQGSEEQPIAILQQMIDLAKQYMNVEPDQQDVATMAKVHTTLQTYLAKDQADREAALGNGSIARLVRKTP